MKELDAEFSKALSDLNEELKVLERKILSGEGRRVEQVAELRRKFHDFRRRLLEARLEVRGAIREAWLKTKPSERSELEELKEEVDEFFERWSETVEEFLDNVRDLARQARPARVEAGVALDRGLESLGEEVSRGCMRWLRWWCPAPAAQSLGEEVSRIIERSIGVAMKSLDEAMKKLDKALKGGAAIGPSYVVSVRLPQADLDVADALVEAGVFKSRSEAVAFLAHKGVESVKPVLQELMGKLEELKKTQEKLREELRRALEGELGGAP